MRMQKIYLQDTLNYIQQIEEYTSADNSKHITGIKTIK